MYHNLHNCWHYWSKVAPKHVKEAFRLLNKSIIRVETPDIQFDEDDNNEEHEGRIVTTWSTKFGMHYCE